MLKYITAALAISPMIAPVALTQGTGTSSNATYSKPETNTPSSAKPGSPGQADASVTTSIIDQEACKTVPSTRALPGTPAPTR